LAEEDHPVVLAQGFVQGQVHRLDHVHHRHGEILNRVSVAAGSLSSVILSGLEKVCHKK
jgi:hypothetical protein